MKNKKFWLGMFLMVLVFGLFISGCATTESAAEPAAKSMVQLEEELDIEMRYRAIELAQARYRNTDFQRIDRIDSFSQTYGDSRILQNTYKVYLIGNILGIIGSQVDVVVTGEINTSSNSVQILEARIIN